MKDELQVVVKRPLTEIEAEVRKLHNVNGPLAEVTVDSDFLILVFGPQSEGQHLRTDSPTRGRADSVSVQSGQSKQPRRRRRRARRRRIHTRGWSVCAKFTNSRGQRCNIYKPFYDAIKGQKLTRREASMMVREIMRKNGNSNPAPASVDYFVDNTFEFIKSERSGRVESG